MLLKIFKHGTGDPDKVHKYLLRETDWTGEKRSSVEVLRGDPEMVSLVAADLAFVHKYTSGAFSFAKDDHPTDEQINEVLDLFEETAWAGLGQNRYVWTAVRHEKDGRIDVHIYAARVDLETGKSLNIAPPGWFKTFNLLCEHFNYKNGWARPDDPLRKRSLSPDYYPEVKKLRESHEDFKQVLHEYIESKIVQGQIVERPEIVQELIECGFEVPRQGKDYITVKDPETKKKFRMKGGFYERDFNIINFAKAEAEERDRIQANGGIDLEKSGAAWSKLQEKIEKRAEHHRKTYPGTRPGNQSAHARDAKPGSKAETLNTDNVDEIFTDPGDSLFNHLQLSSWDDSILQEEHPGTDYNPAGTDQRDSISGKYKEVEDDGNTAEDFRVVEEVQQRMERILGHAKQAIRGLKGACSRLEQAGEVIAGQDRRLDEVRVIMDRELEEFKSRNLVEIAEGYGYAIDHERSTATAVSMRSGEHKIVVGQAQDGHGIYFTVDGQQEQGSVIDFVQSRLMESGQPSNLGYVRKELRNSNFSFSCRPSVSDASTIKPKKCSKDRFAVEAEILSWDTFDGHPYLDGRGLGQVLEEPRFKGCVKIDDRGNVCFPHRDRQGYCGAEIKNHSFTGQVKQGTKGLWLSNLYQDDQRLVICESAIDCLSYHLLHGEPRTRYASFGGALSDRQRALLQALMQKTHDKGQEIVIAVDRDGQGSKYEQELMSLAPANASIKRHLPVSKDFNDDLCNQQNGAELLTRAYSELNL